MSFETITLNDDRSGTSAQILPGLGFNCFAFTARPNGQPVKVIWSHPNYPSGTMRPASSGIPLLFPFAGRIRGTSFQYGGRRFELAVGDRLGNALHGFVVSRRWRVIDCQPARAVGQFQASVDDPRILESWPADFRITVEYELEGNRLACRITVDNPADVALPFGLGVHPYFRVPLGSGGTADECRLTVPVSTRWELAELLPTGQERRSRIAARLAEGIPLAETRLDDVFGGLTYSEHRATARVDDPRRGRRVSLSFDDAFSKCVVFNPPHREAICVEPYTTVPDPFTLQAAGVDAGLRLLDPGGSWTAGFEISAS